MRRYPPIPPRPPGPCISADAQSSRSARTSSRLGSTTRTLFAERGAGDERPSFSTSATSTLFSTLVSRTTRLRQPRRPSGVGFDEKVHWTNSSSLPSIPLPANSSSSPYLTGAKNRLRHLRATTPVPPFSCRFRRVLSSVRVRDRLTGGKKTRRVRRTRERAAPWRAVSERVLRASALLHNHSRIAPALATSQTAPLSASFLRDPSNVKAQPTHHIPRPALPFTSSPLFRLHSLSKNPLTYQEG